MTTVRTWLGKLRHDLCKRMVWPARDRRDLGGTRAPGELLPGLRDDEGRPIAAVDLWAALRREAPAGVPAAALDAFGRAVAAAAAGAARGDVAAVLKLDADFAELARAVEAR